MTTQSLDLILSQSFDARGINLLASAVWEDNGIPGDAPQLTGVGAPAFVGRNRTLALTLNLESVDATSTPLGTLDVSIETAASQQSQTWRTLGSFPTQNAAGMTQLSLVNADAFVRARYTLSSGSAFSFAVFGDATMVVLASAAQAASGVGAALDVAQYRSSRIELSATAVSGTLSVTVETCQNASAPASSWLTVATYPVVTDVAVIELPATNLSRFVRVRWTLAGTATFGVSGVSVLTLATPSDRARLGLRAGAFPELSTDDADSWLVDATATVLGTLGGRYEFPPRSWEDDIRSACIAIADWRALGYGRGTEPGKSIDTKQLAVYERYCYYVGSPEPNAPKGWLQRVADRKEHPLNFVDSSAPNARSGQTQRLAVSSAPLRGWGDTLVRVR